MSTLLPEVIGDFLKEHYDVELELITNSTANLIGENEIVIRADFKLQNDIEKKNLPELSMHLYASIEYIPTYNEPKKIEDLTTHKMLFNSNNQIAYSCI